MEIKRELFGEEVSIRLSGAELVEAYYEYKNVLDYNEVKDYMAESDIGWILERCKFPYPGVRNFTDVQVEKIEEHILENKELLLSVHACFEEEIEIARKAYYENMDYAIAVKLAEFGRENSEFLNQFETIQQVAYEKYKKSWVEERNYSEEFLAGIRKEFEEKRAEFGWPSCFEEYIDAHGYHGECYACFEEFLDCEYQDKGYMKELLTEAEFTEYCNDQGISLPVLEFGKLYEEENLTYLTNALGEYDEMPPEAPYEWYKELGIGTNSLLYLVNLEGKVGVLALHEYDDCFCEDDFKGELKVMQEFVKEKVSTIAEHEALKGYQVIKGFKTGFEDCDEIGLFIPYPTDAGKVKKLLSTYDGIAYEGVEEFMERKSEVMHKEYSDYSELREDLQSGTYDIVQDSIGQLNKEGYSADITVRDYDGKLCIDYDVYEIQDSINKHLDGGKVCDVSQMPAREEEFLGLIEEAVQEQLKHITNKGLEDTLDCKITNAQNKACNIKKDIVKNNDLVL